MKRLRDGESKEDELGVPSSVESELPQEISKSAQSLRRKCPYLDTVNRTLLDFDSEKLCSQTLTNKNVYVCLVCGKYFEGRGKNTPAYTHSVNLNHYVFMNVDSGRAYCLPDSYEIFDIALNDIQNSLSPKFTLKEVSQIDANTDLSRDVHGITYLPGFVGLNNLNATDDINVALHLFSHVKPFRDFFLQKDLFALNDSKILNEFGLIMRKLWSPHNFKCIVSPQELVQIISVESKRKFSIGSRCEVLELFSWLLMTLQKELNKNVKRSLHTNVLYEPFQGSIKVVSYTKKLVDNYEEQKFLEKLQPNELSESAMSADGWIRQETTMPFTYLSLDIPPCPLFRDSQGGLIIPQVPLFQLLQKFDGQSWHDTVTKDAHIRKQFHLQTLPQYLILHLVRFTRNNFSLEKNPTIVTFPVKNLEMKNLLAMKPTSTGESSLFDEAILQALSTFVPKTIQELHAAKVYELEDIIEQYGSQLHRMEYKLYQQQCKEAMEIWKQTKASSPSSVTAEEETQIWERYQKELVCIVQAVQERIELFTSTKYDLIANICHESDGKSNGITIGDVGMNTTNAMIAKKQKSSSLAAVNALASTTSIGNNISTKNTPAAGADLEDVVNRGHYKIHLPFKVSGQWYELQDLHVTETTPQLIGVSESYILVYEKKKVVKASKKAASEKMKMDR